MNPVSPATIAEIKRLRATGLLYRDIGQRVGVSAATAHRYAQDVEREPERTVLRVWCPGCRSFGIPAADTVCDCGARRQDGWEPRKVGDRC